MSKCTEPIPDLPVPSGPHGIFAIFLPGSPFAGDATTYLLHNRDICGGLFYVLWGQIDKGPGAIPRYDWSSVDRQIQPWIEAGKRVAIEVWAVSYGGRIATPSYVLSQVDTVRCPSANPNATQPGFPNSPPVFRPRGRLGIPLGPSPGGRTGRQSPPVPVFWESGFVKNYQDFIAAVIARYASNPSVAYMRIGLGAGGESTPRCHQAMVRCGYSVETWQKYVFEMLDFERSLHCRRQLIVGITNPQNFETYEFPRAEAARAVADGLGLGSQGLQVGDIESYRTGRPCGTADRCAIFQTYRGKVPLELQTLFKTDPGGGRVGSLVDILPFGLKIHAQIFELYPQDLLLAYDPQFPGYAQYHASYEKAIESTTAAVGGS